MTPNLSSFLSTIRHAEGTDKYPNPYAVCFANKFTIKDFSEHPTVIGTWHGERLDFLGPAYAGKISTAAGAYQIIAPTWRTCKRLLHLPDFSPASQDAAAIELIREHGALDLVNSGQISAAIEACHGVWSSLPGSTPGQPQAKLSDLVQFYSVNGGAFA